MLLYKSLARPYATAVFETAQQAGTQDDWRMALSLCVQLRQAMQDAGLLSQSDLSAIDVHGFWMELMQGRFDQQTKNFLNLLIAHKRLYLLPEILAFYEGLCLEAQNFLVLDYYAARPLDSTQQQALQKHWAAYFKKKLDIRYHRDAQLLGGYRIQAGSLVIDGSIAGYLAALEGRLNE